MGAISVNGRNEEKKETFFSFSLPQTAQLFDLFDLRHDVDFAAQWMEGLLNKKALRVTVNAQTSNEQSLRHLFFESRQRERLSGQRALAFGYPIIAIHQDGHVFSGPLFYWPLLMEPSPNTTESWTLSPPTAAEPRCNPVIREALSDLYGASFQAELDGFFSSRMDADALQQFILQVLNVVNLDISGDVLTPVPCPSAEALGYQLAPGGLFWSGIVGLLPENATLVGEAVLPPQEDLPPQGHPLGILDLDPWQASAFQRARKTRVTVAEGISGTGKTHLVTNLILHALSNGQKCLVVAPTVPALRAIQNSLGRQGIQTLDLLIRDAASDQAAVLGLIRSAIQAPPNLEPFPSERFKLLLEKASRMQEKLDAAYRTSRKTVFGNYSWMETVGLFLQSQQIAGKELLGQQLYTQDYDFTFEEYQLLRQGISDSQTLYPRVNTLKHPLSGLHNHLFTQKSKTDSLSFIRQQLNSFSERAGHLHRRYILTLNSYSDKLEDLFHTRYKTLRSGIFHLNGLLTDYSNQFGNSFEFSAETGLRISRIFSRQAADILGARKQVQKAYTAIEAAFMEQPIFPFPWLSTKARKSIPKIRQNLADLEQALNHWNESLPLQIQEDVNRLNSKVRHPELPFEEAIAEIEDGLESLLADLKAATIFQQPYEHQALTIPQRLKYLEEVLESLDHIHMFLKDFDDFYDWQRHWLELPEKGRKIVRALVKAKPHDWTAALDSWYFHQCLSIHFSPELPAKEDSVTELANTIVELRPLLLSSIRTQWDKRREAAARELRRSGKKNPLSASKDPLLPQVFQALGNEFTEIFPVVLATPETAALLFNQTSDFEYVIVEEAQAIPATAAAPLLCLGRRAFIVSDPGQQTSVDDSSLPGLCHAADYAVSPLQMIHRQSPGNLFQKASPCTVVEQTIPGFQFQFTHVHGFFHEKTGINDQEAQAVLQLLNHIKANPQRTMPSVGIICGTPQQRDLISYYLMKIKQKNDHSADVLQQLERNGLGVFCWSETLGQHFDEVLLSTTFGPDGPRNSRHNFLEALNTPGILAQLATLMSRAHYKIHILCSIEESELQNIAARTGLPGPCLWANYLLWIAALQKGQKKIQMQIWQRVENLLAVSSTDAIPSGFLQAVETALYAYIGKKKSGLDVPFDYFSLPLAIKDAAKEKTVAAICADGSFYYTPETDWMWEHRIHNKLTEQHIAFISVSSADWWRDAKEEGRKLAGKILKL